MKRSKTLRVHGYSKLDIVASQINEKLDHKTDRLRELIDKNAEVSSEILKTLNSMDKTLIVNTDSLVRHMQRTTQLENRIVPVEEAFKNLSGFVTTVKTIGGWTIGIGAFVTAVLKMLGKV